MSLIMDNKIINLRAFATFVVVFGHIIIVFDNQWLDYTHFHYDYNNEALYSIKKLINSFQMELFIMISGFCSAFSINKYNLKSFVVNKFKRLIIPFITTGVCYLIPIRLIANYPAYENLPIFEILVNFIIVKDSGHLWFLPVLFFISLITFFNRNYNIVILIISMICAAIIYAIAGSIQNLFISNIFHYLIFYILGFYLNLFVYLPNTRIRYTLIITTIISLVILFCQSPNTAKGFFISLIICGVLYFIMPKKTSVLTEKLNKNSMSIYLLHAPILMFGYKYLCNTPPLCTCLYKQLL